MICTNGGWPRADGPHSDFRPLESHSARKCFYEKKKRSLQMLQVRAPQLYTHSLARSQQSAATQQTQREQPRKRSAETESIYKYTQQPQGLVEKGSPATLAPWFGTEWCNFSNFLATELFMTEINYSVQIFMTHYWPKNGFALYRDQKL